MEIHGEIAWLAQEIGGDSMVIEVFFFLSNEKEIGVYVFGPKDDKIIEKMSCAIMTNEYVNHVPEMRYMLYYATDEDPLLAGIKSK